MLVVIHGLDWSLATLKQLIPVRDDCGFAFGHSSILEYVNDNVQTIS